MTTPLDDARERADRMMEALGLDREELRRRGILRDQEFLRIAEKCAGCIEVGACEHWVADGEADHGKAPEYCRNKFLFDVLTD